MLKIGSQSDENMIDTIIHFILRKFIIIGILVPIVLILKFVVYRKLQTSTSHLTDFFFYSYSNIATTHNPERKKNKATQNNLFILLLLLIVLQLILLIPLLAN